MSVRVHRDIQIELERTGLPWEAKMGSRHVKVYLGGRLVAILPKHGRDPVRREAVNTVSQIRRMARELSQ